MTTTTVRYIVRLRVGPDHAYESHIRFPRHSKPTRRQLEAAARRDAVAAFGKQARGWKFMDARRAGR